MPLLLFPNDLGTLLGSQTLHFEICNLSAHQQAPLRFNPAYRKPRFVQGLVAYTKVPFALVNVLSWGAKPSSRSFPSTRIYLVPLLLGSFLVKSLSLSAAQPMRVSGAQHIGLLYLRCDYSNVHDQYVVVYYRSCLLIARGVGLRLRSGLIKCCFIRYWLSEESTRNPAHRIKYS